MFYSKATTPTEEVEYTVLPFKTFAAVTVVAAGTGYLAYTGRLAPLAAATADKISAFISGTYALGCQACAAAAPYASAGVAKIVTLYNYSITVLTPYAAAASAKAAPYTAMIGMTPVTLSIALGATITVVVVVLLAKRCMKKEEENLELNYNKCQYGFEPNSTIRLNSDLSIDQALEVMASLYDTSSPVSQTSTNLVAYYNVISTRDDEITEEVEDKQSRMNPKHRNRKSLEVRTFQREISNYKKDKKDGTL